MPSEIKVGIIGLGVAGREHLKAFQGLSGVRVVAVSDVSPRAAHNLGTSPELPRFYDSYKDMLRKEKPDAAVICTPTHAHRQPTLDAIRAGCHVLVESPVALKMTDAAAMVAAARQAKRVFASASSRLKFRPATLLAREILRSGDLGHIYHIRTSRYRRLARPGVDVHPGSAWLLDRSKSGGGVGQDMGGLEVDVVRWILGAAAVRSVRATVHRGVEPPPPRNLVYDVDESLWATVEFATHTTWALEISWSAHMDEGDGIRIFGTRGGMRLDPPMLFRLSGGRPHEVKPQLAGQEDPFALQQDFLRAVTTGHHPATDGDDALAVTEILLALQKSAETGREVKLKQKASRMPK